MISVLVNRCIVTIIQTEIWSCSTDQYEVMISASVWLLAVGNPVTFDVRKFEVAPWSSVPAANVSLNTAELLVFRSTAFVAIWYVGQLMI